MTSKKENLLIIEHRINTIEQLKRVPLNRGVEIDIRDYKGELMLTHEPFDTGNALPEFLKSYQHKFIIFNVKSAGLESRILELTRENNINNFFFLDVENTCLVNFARKGMKKAAVRFSDFEPIEFAMSFAGKLDWVWVDCFERIPDKKDFERLSQYFKVCLVSPEMQKHPKEWITNFRKQGIPIDAVCTDLPELWEKSL